MAVSLKKDALNAQNSPIKEGLAMASIAVIEAQTSQGGVTREVRREKMTRLRKTIASRLTEAKNSTSNAYNI